MNAIIVIIHLYRSITISKFIIIYTAITQLRQYDVNRNNFRFMLLLWHTDKIINPAR